MITRKEELKQKIRILADEMDSLEYELRECQEEINKMYAEYDSYDESWSCYECNYTIYSYESGFVYRDDE